MVKDGRPEWLNAQAQAALDLLQRGQLSQAEALCRGILESQPDHFHGLHLMGIIALNQADAARAVRLLRAATQAQPAQPAAWSNLAAALLAAHQPAEALAACDVALKLQPSSPQHLVNRGHSLTALGRHPEAVLMYQRAQAASPQRPDVYIGAGNALYMLGRFEESLAQYERARSLDPTSADILTDIARTHLQLKQPEAALSVLIEALRLRPASAAALSVKGSALRQLQRPREAIASYEAALRVQPKQPDVHSNIANVTLQLGRYEDALAACDQALSLEPRHAQANNIRAHALRGLGRIEEAAAAFDRLLELAPDFDYARGNRLYMRASLCDWTDYAADLAILEGAVAAGRRACQPMSFLAFTDKPDAQLICARIAVADRYPPKPRYPTLQARHDPIRIAYLSTDFKNHPVAHLLAGVLETHDRERFRIHALSIENEPRDGPMRARIRGAVDHYEDVSRLSDREVAERLRALEIDIAVDLNGHTQSARLGIFAAHPVAVQVGFLGYTGTTGADYIDYVIADETSLPKDMDAHFSERIVRLPHCFLPNDDRQAIASPAPSRESLGLPANGFVYCAFNNAYKINPAMFDVWMRLLRETTDSVLWLKGERPTILENLRREAQARAVAAERLVFAPRVPTLQEHLARYQAADMFLDTLPYGAHATSRDALWAGLPVLTCAGRAFSSRVAMSLLTGLGLPELVATSLDDYAARALELSREPAQLQDLRARLARHRFEGPTFATERYCRALEAAFLDML